VSWVQRVLIVPDAYVALARSLAAGIATGDSGKGMWTTGLNASGSGVATHWISSGLIWPQFAAMLDDSTGQAIFTAAGGQIPLATVQAMLAASTIRANADPFAVLAQLGLKIINPPMP
jgi:hypothetical protein